MNEQLAIPNVDQAVIQNSNPDDGSNERSNDGSHYRSAGGFKVSLDVPPQIRELHAKALAAVARLKTAELELLQVLDEAERCKVYLRYGYNSLFQYAVQALGLSEGVAYNFINVGRAAREIPELKAEIASGALSVSKARKMTSVLTRENSATWIEFAKTSSQQKLEREVSLANPRELGRGRMSYVPAQSEIAEKVVVKTSVVSPGGSTLTGASTGPAIATGAAGARVTARVQLEVGISERLMIKIRHAQGLLGQKLRRGATLEETLEAMADLYLSKHDPNERAKRQLIRGKLKAPSETSGATDSESATPVGTSASAQKISNLQFLRIAGETSASNSSGDPARARAGSSWTSRLVRRPLPAATKHRVHLKFESRCSHVDHRGKRCQETKFLEIHHLRPLHLGGDDRLENLTLLCSGHHKGIHLG
ncbi:MAG: HNH endonuclease [Bdellovibrionales bacterium]|nr:HNH endonuclease [Bdellovibrionales bacterium]